MYKKRKDDRGFFIIYWIKDFKNKEEDYLEKRNLILRDFLCLRGKKNKLKLVVFNELKMMMVDYLELFFFLIY